ncbi:MAG: class I SAM-dependent methyltransferase [Pirellulales bacterium]|nr:class I SAM-dependent methyltransferase [Pirellulales bacterium]
MGLVHDNIRFLLAARRDGYSFKRIVTLGRQQLYLHTKQLESLTAEFADLLDARTRLSVAAGDDAEDFLRWSLESREIDSIDGSGFESATIIHDMNHPIDAALHNQYDAVIDGGTLEHIFNTPIALSNCMRMVRVGGCLAFFAPANNHCGHGFYQFSPELFFRVFDAGNGFEVVRLVLMQHQYPGPELSMNTRCYEVIDPDAVKSRVGLISPQAAMIMVLARKIASVDPLTESPIQSDYQRRWDDQQSSSRPGESSSEQSADTSITAARTLRRMAGKIKRRLVRQLPLSVQLSLVGRQQRRDYSLKNSKFYRVWNT